MKVEELMTRETQTCTPETNLVAAAMRMWEGDCGTLPVLTDGGRVVGMITDRDICIAAATKHRAPAEIAVSEAMTGKVYACAPDADVHDALKTMRQERIHRLPVVDAEGKLRGILSMNDVVLKAEEAKDKKTPDLSYADVVATFKAICAHPALQKMQQQPAQQKTATA